MPPSREAVAQTPTELTEAVLRVGSKIVRLVARTQRDRTDSGAVSVRYGDHGAPSLGFRGRLYATASRESERATGTQPWTPPRRGPPLVGRASDGRRA